MPRRNLSETFRCLVQPRCEQIENVYHDCSWSSGSDDEMELPLARCSTPVHDAACSIQEECSPSRGSLDEFVENEEQWENNEWSNANSMCISKDDSDQMEDGEDVDEETVSKLWTMGNSTCKLSLFDYVNLLVAISAIYKIPDVAMDVFCGFLAAALPEGHEAPLTFTQVIKMQRSMGPGSTASKISFICNNSSCGRQLQKLFDYCENLGCSYHGHQQHATGFVHFSIRSQIDAIVKTHFDDICHHISSCQTSSAAEDTIGDIVTSPAYDAHGPNPQNGILRISLIISSDGVQAFKSGRSSFWPCLGVIAELPPKLRFSIENSICFGFWVGRNGKKPDFKQFITPIISELKSLGEGYSLLVKNRNLVVRVCLLGTIFDLPAQASIWGHKQFNGNFCFYLCFHFLIKMLFQYLAMINLLSFFR